MRNWLFFPSVIGADRRAILQAKKKTIFQAKNRKKRRNKTKNRKTRIFNENSRTSSRTVNFQTWRKSLRKS